MCAPIVNKIAPTDGIVAFKPLELERKTRGLKSSKPHPQPKYTYLKHWAMQPVVVFSAFLSYQQL